MFEIFVTSSVLILVILALRLLLRNRVSQRLIYGLWLLVALRLLIPFNFVQSPVSVMAPVNSAIQQSIQLLRPDRNAEQPPFAVLPDAQQNLPTANATDAPAAENNTPPIQSGQPVQNTGTGGFLAPDRVRLLRFIWLVGAAAMLIWFLVVNLMFRHKLRTKSVPIQIASCALPIYWCEEIPSPCLFGLFRPAIYLTRFSADQADKLTDVVTHELCHWRHLDHLWAVVRCLCVSLYWFNPLVWAAARVSKTDCELACDEATVRQLGEGRRIEYGRTLVQMVAQQSGYSARSAAATTMTAGKKAVRRRIDRIIREPKRSLIALTALLLCAAVATACTFTGAPARQQDNVYANPDGQTRLVAASAENPDSWTVLETVSAEQTSFLYDCTQTALREAAADLAAKNGITAEQAYDELLAGGYTLYLSIDPALQDLLEETAYDPAYWDNDSRGGEGNNQIWPPLNSQPGESEQPDRESPVQAAMIILRYDGSVAAITNGIREKDGAQRSRALRQPGSVFSPLSAYAPALEYGKANYSTVLPDQPLWEEADGAGWPRNFSENYGDPVTLYDGLRTSLNTTPAQLMQETGVDSCYDLLCDGFGFTSLADGGADAQETDRTLSLSLGSLRSGVSLYELAAAYQVFGNGGIYYQPHIYTHLYNQAGELVLDKTAAITPVQVLSPQTAYTMNQMLRGVAENGTGTYMVQNMPQGMPVAAKTGMTSDNTDFWAVGMTPYYLTAVWSGADTAESLTILRPQPVQLAFDHVMSHIHQNLEAREFDRCEGIVELEFCTETGLLADAGCPKTQIGYYPEDAPLSRVCEAGH